MEYYYSQILGISARESLLPIPMKIGKVWDKFMENDPNTDYKAMCDRLEIEPKERAKLQALMRAFEDIGVERVKGIPQLQVRAIIDNHTVHGYIDNGLSDGFEEFKLSSNPVYYQKIGKIYHQCGTYFLADPSFEYVDMKITQVPLLRTGSGQYVEESTEDFQNRIYYDILSRPAHYYIGYDMNTRKWGKNTITLNHTGSGDNHTASKCAFKKVPDYTNAKDGSLVEWVFDSIKLDMKLGTYE